MALPLSLQGGAIGLVLVFRTNNAYARLEEARDMWRSEARQSKAEIARLVALPVNMVDAPEAADDEEDDRPIWQRRLDAEREEEALSSIP